MNDLENHVSTPAEALPQSVPQPLPAHTPGPWDFCKPHHRWLVYPVAARDDGIDYFVASAIETEHGEAVAKANARLIAAAPELLADIEANARIMRFLIDELQGRIEGGKIAALRQCLVRSQEVIAKATGAA